MNIVNKIFSDCYDVATREIQFNPDWSNGTGYYDNAVRGVYAPRLEIGEIAKSFSGGENRRRILFIGTRFGNVVVFDRYTDAEGEVFVQNTPDEVRKLEIIGTSRLGEADMNTITGGCLPKYNIGNHIELMARILA